MTFGIKEGAGHLEGKASEICDVSCPENDDDLKLKIEDLIRKGIRSGIVDADVEIVSMAPDKRVLVVHVPESQSKPHMVTHSGLNKIYKRHSSGIYEPDLEELKRMFIESGLFQTASARNTLDEIREYRRARLDSIRKGETLVSINEDPKLVLHIIPNNFGKAQWDIDLSKMGSGYSFAFDQVYLSNDKSYYISVSEDGCFEFVCRLVTKSDYIGSVPEDKNIINALDIEGALLHFCLSEVLKYFPLLGQGASLYFMLSLLNVEGFKLDLADRVKFELHSVDFNAYRDPQPIHQRDLVVTELLVEDPKPTIEFLQNALRPAIDKLWRASGWPRSKKLRHR